MNLLLIFSNISASVVRGSAEVGGGPESAREPGGSLSVMRMSTGLKGSV